MNFNIMMTYVHQYMDTYLGPNPNDDINNWIELFFIQEDERYGEKYNKNKKYKIFEVNFRYVSSKVMNFSIRYDTEINFKREMLRRINKAYFEADNENTRVFERYEDFSKANPEIYKSLCHYFGENPMLKSDPVGIHEGIHLIDNEVSFLTKSNESPKFKEPVNFDSVIPF